MSPRSPSGTPQRGEGPESDTEGIDLSAPSLREWAQYILHAAQRQRWLVAAVFVAGMAVTTAFYLTKTPLYRVETKVLAQRQQALPSIARSGAPDEAPTRTAYEIVHRRENLVSLLKQTNLIPAPGSEPARSSWRRWISDAFSTGPEAGDAADEALNRLVLRLDKELVVTVGDGTITISLDWPNPEEAYQLVQAALQNFLEARQVQEITAIDDAISLLQERLVAARAQLAKATDDAQRGAVRTTVDLAPGRSVALRAPASEELQMLGVALEAKERSIRDLEEFRRRRLMDLQAQLQEKRGIYSDSYPAVIALRKEVDAMHQESPQLATLQEEARRMREEYAARAAEENRNRASSSRNGATATVRSVPSGPLVEDQAMRDARVQYEQMLSRVNTARAELDTARAAFKYRYTVAWPARVPRKPVSPNPITVFGAGTLASLLLAFAAAVRFGVSDELIRERWQVERKLGVPVLAEFLRK